MKSFLTTLALCSFHFLIHAQNVDFKWLGKIGGVPAAISRGVCLDSASNAYVAGSFTGTLSAGSASLPSAGLNDVFLLKYAPTGNVLMAKQFGSTGQDYAFDVDCTPAGEIYLTGGFSGSMSIGGTTLTSGGMLDVITAKLSTDGNLLWARKGGGTRSDYGNEIKTDPGGAALVVVNAGGNVTFENETLTGDTSDIFVVKYDKNGNKQWLRGLTGPGSASGRAVGTDNAGNVLLAGSFSGTLQAGAATLNTNGPADMDIFVAKLDENGNFLWARRFGNSATAEYARGIGADSSGCLYVSGVFEGTITFGSFTLSSTNNSKDLFLLRLSPAGDVLSALRIGGPGEEEGCELEVAQNGTVYLSGGFSGSMTLGTATFTAAGVRDVFMAAIKADGAVIWAKNAGGPNDDVNYAVSYNPVKNDMVTVGTFSGSFSQGSQNITATGNSVCSYVSGIGPGAPAGGGGKQEKTLNWGGLPRTYDVYLPTGFTASTKRPLVVSLHPGLSNAANHANAAKWQVLGDTANFISVYPNGTTAQSGSTSYSWNAYSPSTGNNVDDVGFLNAMLDSVIRNYNVDTCRIYLAGFSNGAWMTYRMACDFTRRFAAIAPLSGSWKYGTDGRCDHGGCDGSPIPGTNPPSAEALVNCTPLRKIPVMYYRGTRESSLTDRAVTDPNLAVFWSQFNNCNLTPVRDTFVSMGDQIIREQYTGCSDGNRLIVMNVVDNSHQWHASATQNFWLFLRNYSLCNPATSVVESVNIPFTEPALHLYPNPAGELLQVVLNLPQASTAQLTLYDAWGRVIQAIPLSSPVPAGLSTREISLETLSGGLYFLELRYGQTRSVQRFVRL